MTSIDHPVPAVSASNTQTFAGVVAPNILMDAATKGTLSRIDERNHNTVFPNTKRHIDGSAVKIALLRAVSAHTSDKAATASKIQIKNLSVVISVF
jgi:hypothetical protein